MIHRIQLLPGQTLSESLQQQTATADVLKVISRSTFDLDAVLTTLTRSAVSLCRAARGTVFLRDGDVLRIRANVGTSPEFVDFLTANPIAPTRQTSTGRTFLTGEITHLPDVLADPEYDFGPAPEIGQFRSALGVPLLRQGKVEGVFALSRPEAGGFTDREIELIRTFADQAVIAIENVRLFNETQEALERQTATADILKVIASSPDDVQPVLQTLAVSALRLCEALSATVLLRDGEVVIPLAHVGPLLAPLGERQPLHRGWVTGRAVLEGITIHVPDMLEMSESEYPDGKNMALKYGHRATLATPLIREGRAIGAILVRRRDPRPFSNKQIALLETFADQAVIAIENVRLFNETQEALERQTATADILKVIASSPDDVQPVFDAIAERSNRLADGLATAVYRLADDTVHLMAFTPISPAADAALRAAFPAPLSQFNWSVAIGSGETYLIGDAEVELATRPSMLELARLRGWRSVLAVPLMREGRPIGLITVTRVEPGRFDDHHVQLLRTFADQAVIAISNVELFNEVQARTRELSQSLDDLRAAQDRLVQTEKLASLGQLTAGIAHEIKNPLNFVNNFSALSAELTDELNDTLKPVAMDGKVRKEVDELTGLLKDNLEKVVQHGKRADSIVKNMLLHSREGSGEHRLADINAIVDESLNLAYHGARAEKPNFNVTMQRSFDPAVGTADVYPQEITRVLLNLISNGFYAAAKRKTEAGDGFEPTLLATTKDLGENVEIRIRDNGTGIPDEVKVKIFNPFFTTKPAGEGTGLGLSMSHDIIVKQHGGKIEVETEPGQFTEFRIVLPRTNNFTNK